MPSPPLTLRKIRSDLVLSIFGDGTATLTPLPPPSPPPAQKLASSPVTPSHTLPSALPLGGSGRPPRIVFSPNNRLLLVWGHLSVASFLKRGKSKADKAKHKAKSKSDQSSKSDKSSKSDQSSKSSKSSKSDTKSSKSDTKSAKSTKSKASSSTQPSSSSSTPPSSDIPPSSSSPRVDISEISPSIRCFSVYKIQLPSPSPSSSPSSPPSHPSPSSPSPSSSSSSSNTTNNEEEEDNGFALTKLYSEPTTPFHDACFSPDSQNLALLPRAHPGMIYLLDLLHTDPSMTTTRPGAEVLGVVGPIDSLGPGLDVFGNPFRHTRITVNPHPYVQAMGAPEYATWNEDGLGMYLLWRIHHPLPHPLSLARLLRPSLVTRNAGEDDDTPKMYIKDMAFDPFSGLVLGASVAHDNFTNPDCNGLGFEMMYAPPIQYSDPVDSADAASPTRESTTSPLFEAHRRGLVSLVPPSSWFKVSDGTNLDALGSLAWGVPLVLGASSPSLSLLVHGRGVFEISDMHFGSAFSPTGVSSFAPTRLAAFVSLGPHVRFFAKKSSRQVHALIAPESLVEAGKDHPRWSGLFGLDAPLSPIDASGLVRLSSSHAPGPSVQALSPDRIYELRAGLGKTMGYFITALWDLNVSLRYDPKVLEENSNKSRKRVPILGVADGGTVGSGGDNDGSGARAQGAGFLLPDPMASAEVVPYMGVVHPLSISRFVGVHLPQCMVCGLVLVTPLTCSACRSATYCSQGCQAKHWPYHSTRCTPPPSKAS